MQAGARVRSLTCPEKGTGVVLGIQHFFEESFVDVFFEKTRERRMLPQSDLLEDHDLLYNLQGGRFSPAPRFLLRLLLEQVREESAGDGLQAAGTFKILPLPHQLLARVGCLIDCKLKRKNLKNFTGIKKQRLRGALLKISVKLK